MFCASMLNVCSTETVSLMSTFDNVAVEPGGVSRYPHPYYVAKYISRCVPCLNARWFAMMLVG